MPPKQQNQNYSNNSVTPIDSPSTQTPQVQHKGRRRLIWILNIVPPALFILLMSYLSYEQNHGTSGTEYIGLIVAPFFGFLFLAAIITDIVLLIRYLRKEKNTATRNNKKRIFAWSALTLILLLISFVIFSFISSAHQSNQLSKQIYLDHGANFKSDYKLAQDAGYGFNILLPSYSPQKYSYFYGSITSALSGKDTAFGIQYRNSSDTTPHEYDLYMFKLPPTYNPPQNCAYPFGQPREDNPDSLENFSCSAISTSSNGTIYYALVEKNLVTVPAGEFYYVVKDNTLVSLFVVKDNGSLNQAEAIKILNSLQPSTIDEVVANNIKAGKLY